MMTNREEQGITIAYYLADDSESNAQAQGMADRLAADLGIPVNMYDVSSEGMIIQALRFGNADIGFLEEVAGLHGLDGKNTVYRFLPS